MYRRAFYVVSFLTVAGIAAGAVAWRPALWAYLLVLPLVALGLRDALQTRHAVLRNWPLIGRFR